MILCIVYCALIFMSLKIVSPYRSFYRLMKKPQKVFLKGKIISISNATKIHILSVIPTQHLGMEDVSDFASIKLT